MAGAKTAARDRAAEKLGHRRADINVDSLVVCPQSIGKVAERLAVVDHLLAANGERQYTLGLVTVRLLSESLNNGPIVDGGTQGERVIQAGSEDDVVNEDGTDRLSEEIVVECAIALRGPR